MKKNKLIFPLISILLLSSCSGDNINSIFNSGFEKNQDQDSLIQGDIDDLIDVLTRASVQEKYSYHTTLTIGTNSEEFIDYFTPYAWYEDSITYPSTSFGYAQDTRYRVFKYYLDEENNAVPSVFLDNEEAESSIGIGLYDTFMIASLSLLKGYITESYMAENGEIATTSSPNSYTLTSDAVQSIFQFMTTYGTSIAGYVQSYVINIDNLKTGEFTSVVTLSSSAGIISSKYTPLETTPIDSVNDAARGGTLNGVKYHSDVLSFFDLAAENNYVLTGPRVKENGLLAEEYNFKVNCTEDYFFIDYIDETYEDWGYMYIPSGNEIRYTTSEGGSYVLNNAYDSCFGYYRNSSGEYAFDSFIGPVSEEYTFIAIDGYDNLPETGDESYYYIVKNATTGENSVYIWTVVETDAEGNDVYGYEVFSSYWYSNVGQFYINDASATFYISSQASLLGSAQYYYEQSLTDENYYTTSNSTITSSLANGLFGWGFQQTTTWMDYVNYSFLRINKNSAGEIESAELGLNVSAIRSGTSVSLDVYYEISDFGNANIDVIDTFYNNHVNNGGTN